MEWESYELKRSEGRLQYKFYSEGPQGRIVKAVRFQHRPELGREVYNLAFGDYDERTDRLDDRIVSDNGDREFLDRDKDPLRSTWVLSREMDAI